MHAATGKAGRLPVPARVHQHTLGTSMGMGPHRTVFLLLIWQVLRV